MTLSDVRNTIISKTKRGCESQLGWTLLKFLPVSPARCCPEYQLWLYAYIRSITASDSLLYKSRDSGVPSNFRAWMCTWTGLMNAIHWTGLSFHGHKPVHSSALCCCDHDGYVQYNVATRGEGGWWTCKHIYSCLQKFRYTLEWIM